MLFCAIASLVVSILSLIVVAIYLTTIAGNQIVADRNANGRLRMLLDALKQNKEDV